MKTFIIHANQTVVVSSPQKLWAPETLRSKPPFSIKAATLEAALAKARADVFKRYNGEYQKVESVEVTAALVREIG